MNMKSFTCIVLTYDTDWQMQLHDHLQALHLQHAYPLSCVGYDTIARLHTSLLQTAQVFAVIVDFDGEWDVHALRDSLQLRPELPCFGVSGQASAKMPFAVAARFLKTASAPLSAALVESLQARLHAPILSALRQHALEPAPAFHALPIARGQSFSNSPFFADYAEYFGEGPALPSATMSGVHDSLFEPQGCVKSALQLAARSFFADHTLFVTHGTTGANHIVYRALLQPGDLVLIDRNCHKSHHYAIVHSHAQVVYMEPEHIDSLGISSLISSETIEAHVRRYRDAVKLIALTHPTFDGLLYDPLAIMKRVLAIKPDIIFLFDEAWFAYGVFHPDFRRFSAMYAAWQLRLQGIPCRVYVTQSTHKTLAAMRQASMIHIHEPEMSPSLQFALEEAVMSYQSTSPNVHMLASLDLARVQADLEGFDRLHRALAIAQWIRQSVGSAYLKVLELGDLSTARLRDGGEISLDPLKITLQFQGSSGAALQRDMRQQCGLMIHKYTQNTVLLLVNIAATEAMAAHVVKTLNAWEPRTDRAIAALKPMPYFSGFAAGYQTGVEGAGDLAKAYFTAMQAGITDIRTLDAATGLCSAKFVTPYPPGYPILVPGQIISDACITFIQSLLENGMRNIHGLSEEGRIYIMPDV